jgi:hypothetical protein
MSNHEMLELEPSNDLLSDIRALRARLHDEGYLFFRGILDIHELTAIREDILGLAAQYQLVKPGTPLLEGIYSGLPLMESRKFETSPLYREILELPRFNTFGQHPMLTLLFTGLLEDEIIEHRRRIGRITFPQSFHNTTPPHQDCFYIKGTPDTYTCWIPAGDCPAELGGLAVMPKTNQLASMINHEPMVGTGGHGIPHEKCAELGEAWRTTDFQIGDLLLFHGLTVHKALDNRAEDRMRVSLEYRYQRKRDAIDPSSQQFHMKASFDELIGDIPK